MISLLNNSLLKCNAGFILPVLCLLMLSANAQPIPARKQEKPILITGGVIHVGNGKVIENGAIGMADGKITFVGEASSANKAEFPELIDAKGKHIYPGIIAPDITLGLTEIGSVRATRDFAEVGYINPHVRSIIAYNTDSRLIPTVRSNGILLAQPTPRAGLITGSSSVVELDAWNWEDAVYKVDDGIHINWPSQYIRNWWSDDPSEKNKNYDKEMFELRKFFTDAIAYSKSNPEEKNLRFEAMKGIFDKSQNLFIHANYVKEILAAVDFCRSYGISHWVLVGGNDSWMITDELKKNNVDVIIGKVHELPARSEDDVDITFKLPKILKDAGINFCLAYEGEMEAMGSRNLPFQAGTAVAYGLTKEEGLASITLNTAKILGIDKTVGSLEQGKDATLFISTGDALDMRTNNVEHAFIRGRKIDLDDSQKYLFRKYKGKYKIE